MHQLESCKHRSDEHANMLQERLGSGFMSHRVNDLLDFIKTWYLGERDLCAGGKQPTSKLSCVRGVQ